MKLRVVYNGVGVLIGIVFGAWSICKALVVTSTVGCLTHEQLGTCVIGFGVLVPPAFFWLDWVVFCRCMTTRERDFTKHTHDLSRNIWLALIAMLTVLFKIKLTW